MPQESWTVVYGELLFSQPWNNTPGKENMENTPGKVFISELPVLVYCLDCFSFFFFFFLSGPTHGMRWFPGQELNPWHSSNPSYSSDHAGSLTHWATRKVLLFLFNPKFRVVMIQAFYFSHQPKCYWKFWLKNVEILTYLNFSIF